MIRKFILAGEELEFKMTNQTVVDIDELYGNYGKVFNGLYYGENLYNSAFKFVAASCVTRKLSFEELVEKLTPEQISDEILTFAFNLYRDWRGIKEETSTEESNENDDKKKA